MRWLITVAATFLCVGASSADGYGTFVNARYPYSICYPPFMHARAVAPNGDGRVFTAADGAEMRVYAHYDPDQPLAAPARQSATALLGRGGKLTYFVQKGGWAAFSGTTGDKLVYGKTFKRADLIAAFELTYPRAVAGRYDRVAERLSRCFRLLLA